MPVAVAGSVSPLHATDGVKAPVWAVEKTTPLYQSGRLPLFSRGRSVFSVLASQIYPAMRVGTERTYTL